jgi:hypothetical protein
MVEMKFIRPEFHRGANVTVRLGTEWAGKEGPVKIFSESGDFITDAEIVKTEKKKFAYLTEDDIRLYHDLSCTTVEGLREAMDLAYGREFRDDKMVTIVTLIV